MSSKARKTASWYWDQYNSTTIGCYLTRFEQEFIGKALNHGRKPGPLLDVATGTGRHALPLSHKGVKVFGAELDPVALQVFRQKSTITPLVCGSAHSLPFADSTFQTVLAIQSFEYFDYKLFLPECSRVLKSGGRLILQSLNRNNYKRVARWMLHKIRNRRLWEAEERFSTSELLKVLSDHDLYFERACGYYWLPFNRRSNNVCVRGFAQVEHSFRLSRLYDFSPWVILSVTKGACHSDH